MSGVAECFREIHRLRRHAREMQAEIERAPLMLKAHRNRCAKVEEAFREAQDSLKKLKVKAHENEVSIKSTVSQVGKYEKQRDTVTDTKQMDALKHQIDHGKTSIASLEDEVLTALADIDERTAKLPEQEKATKDAKADLAKFEASSQERLVLIAGELKTALAQLVEVEKQLPLDARQQYQRIVNAHGADSLASVVGQTCQHCHTNITNQQAIELISGTFVLCTNCGRGLYLPE